MPRNGALAGAVMSRIAVLVLLASAPLLLAGVLGCPAAATQFQAVMADSTVMDTDPTPSPDGKWIAFTSTRESPGDSVRQIWIRPIGGGAPRQLTHEPDSARASTPTWAPDSKSLLFISTRVDDYNVYSIPLEGGEARPMTDAPSSNRFAVYSPDGKQIVFPSNRMKPGEIWGFDLYVMNAEGEKFMEQPARRLTNSVGSPGHPTWSPDGKWIAYVAKPIDTTATVSVGPGMTMKKGAMFTAYHLFRVPAAGGAETQLTGTGIEPEPTEEIWPTWSPDGKWIAVQRRVGAADDVWVYEVDTKKFYRITTFGDAGKPTWSADGKSLYFVRMKGKDHDIWVANNLTPQAIKSSAKRAAATKR
jgi:Tol biopolymer transport system component